MTSKRKYSLGLLDQTEAYNGASERQGTEAGGVEARGTGSSVCEAGADTLERRQQRPREHGFSLSDSLTLSSKKHMTV